MVFPESCNCEQRGEGKWFPAIVSGELCLAFHAEITVLSCFQISLEQAIRYGACWEVYEILPLTESTLFHS